MTSRVRLHGTALLAALLSLTAGCGEDETSVPACTELAGECVGVPTQQLCEAEPCVGGAPCANVLPAASDAELQTAAGQATAGDCIALAPGDYGAAALPGGVSLLGRGADLVSVVSITLGDGSGAWIRGLTVQAGGIDAGAATEVQIEAVRISGADTGLIVAAGGAVTVTQSEIVGSGTHGVLGTDPTSIVVERSFLHDNNGPAVWVGCEAGCDCAQKPTVRLDRVLASANRYVSVNFVGVRATMQTVEINDSQDLDWMAYGGALAASQCSELQASGLTVQRAAEFGILVDSSSATLGTGAEEKGIIIIDSKPGIWIQRAGTPAQEPNQLVQLEGVEVADCRGAGIGFDLAARGIIIIDSKVMNSRSVEMLVEPALQGRTATVGHGVVWKAASTATIDALTVSASAGYAVLIDGAVGDGSSMTSVSLSGGDEETGIVQQQVDGQATSPTMGADAPELQRHADQLADVPVGAEPPAALN